MNYHIDDLTADSHVYTIQEIFPGYEPGEIMIDQLLYGSDDEHPAKSYTEEHEAPELVELSWTEIGNDIHTLDWIDAPAGDSATRMNLDTYDYYAENYRITKRAGIVRLHVDDKVAATGVRAMKLRYEVAEHWTPIPRPVKFRKQDWGRKAEARRTRFYSYIDARAAFAQLVLDGGTLKPEEIEQYDLDDLSPEELEDIVEAHEWYNYPEAGQWEYHGVGSYTMREAYAE